MQSPASFLDITNPLHIHTATHKQYHPLDPCHLHSAIICNRNSDPTISDIGVAMNSIQFNYDPGREQCIK